MLERVLEELGGSLVTVEQPVRAPERDEDVGMRGGIEIAGLDRLLEEPGRVGVFVARRGDEPETDECAGAEDGLARPPGGLMNVQKRSKGRVEIVAEPDLNLGFD